MHTESFTRALQEAGHQVDTIAIPFKWVSTGGADPSDGPLAEPRPVRGRWRVDRHGHRPPVPGLPRPARAQGGVAHPPAPNGVRAVGPPGLRRPVDPRGGGGGPRDDPSRRPAGPGRGEARLHQLGQRPQPAAPEPGHRVGSALPPFPAVRGLAGDGARAVRRLRAFPQPAGAHQAAVPGRGGHAARPVPGSAGPGGVRAGRVGAPAQDRGRSPR